MHFWFICFFSIKTLVIARAPPPSKWTVPVDAQAVYRAAMVTALDTRVGRVVDALQATGLSYNTLIVFFTYSGGAGWASNFPLKEMKNTLYEGRVRGVGWVHSPLLKRPGLVSRRLMYVTDWLATLLAVAGLTSLLPAGTDSLDMWPSLQLNKASPREEIVLNLDQDTYWGLWSAAIRQGNYKLIWGQHKLLKTHVSIFKCT